MILTSLPVIFATTNEYKFQEAASVFSDFRLQISRGNFNASEIQSLQTKEIVKSKVIDAFVGIGRPLFVEHTSLKLEFANTFPNGFTSPFLKTIGEERLCEIFGSDGRNKAVAETHVAYCNGRTIHFFTGSMSGVISARPAGSDVGYSSFGWSRIFIPYGHSETLSQLDLEKKNKFSMRAKALRQLAEFLNK